LEDETDDNGTPADDAGAPEAGVPEAGLPEGGVPGPDGSTDNNNGPAGEDGNHA
jgi:hypothetical protein